METLFPDQPQRAPDDRTSTHLLFGAGTVAGLLVGTVVIWLLVLPPSWEHPTQVFHLAMLPLSLLALFLVWRARRQWGSDDQTERTWRILAGAFGFLLVAHATHVIADGVEGVPLLASVAYALDLGFLLTLLWGVSSFGRVQHAAREQNQRSHALVQHACDIITVIAPDTTIGYQSPSSWRALGARPESLTGTLYLERVHPDDRERLFTCVAQALQHPETPTLGEWRIRHQQGSWLHFETYATNRQNDPAIRGIVLNSRDITERKLLEEELKFRAFHDPLTGLANRALFIDRVEQALVRTRRSRRGAALLFLDLDNFKLVNDLLGHAEGDRLLREVASRLRRCIRATDTVARFGGDEFAILLEDMAHPADAALVAERVIRELTIPMRPNDRDIVVSTSIGVAPVGGTESCDELMHHADSMMYLAKKYGRGRYEIFDAALHSDVARRLEMEADFRRALEVNEMVVHYRPIVSLGSHRIVAVEAVLRWHHPKKGLLEMDRFLGVARETEQLVPLGDWLVETVCRQLRAWHLLYPGSALVGVTVPLFAEQMEDAQLVAKVRYALQRTGIRPDTVVLEVPESTLLKHPEGIAQQLVELKALGVRVATAARGGTISPLRHLRKLPLDLVKLPAQGMGEPSLYDPENRGSTLLALDPTGRVKTVVEGVENDDQLELLHRLGFDMAQGPYFSDPVRKEVVEGLLQEGAVLHRPTAAAASGR